MTNPLFDPSALENIIDPTKDYTSVYIGEGKKYADVSAAARAIAEKDAFIERLKAENAQMRNVVKGEQKIDEFLETLKTKQTVPPDGSNPVTIPSQPIENQAQHKSLSLEEVDQFLIRRDQTKAEQANLDFATKKVREAFGANHAHVLQEKANELGATPEFLTSLARTNPAAFLKVVGADKTTTSVSAPKSSMNTQSFPVGSNEKTMAFYTKLRKEIGNAEYFKPAIQNEINQQMFKLGEAFFD